MEEKLYKQTMENDYQWSIKLNNGEIFVIHADTEEHLLTKVASLKTQIESSEPSTPSVPNSAQTQEYICESCGASAQLKTGVSKKGNNYRIMKCSTGNDDHSKFL